MTVFKAAAAYLRLHEPWSDAAKAMEDASGFDDSFVATGGSTPFALRVDDLVGDARTEALLNALRPRMAALPWRQNPTYTDELLLGAYVYCELLGPAGLVAHATTSVGLLYLTPGTTYPPHVHPAEEAYHLLAGPSEWQAGAEPATWRSPGERIEHGSGVAHAMRSGTTPMLALFVWRGDLMTAARLLPVHTPDV